VVAKIVLSGFKKPKTAVVLEEITGRPAPNFAKY
jgi:hypothetical protein